MSLRLSYETSYGDNSRGHHQREVARKEVGDGLCKVALRVWLCHSSGAAVIPVAADTSSSQRLQSNSKPIREARLPQLQPRGESSLEDHDADVGDGRIPKSRANDLR